MPSTITLPLLELTENGVPGVRGLTLYSSLLLSPISASVQLSCATTVPASISLKIGTVWCIGIQSGWLSFTSCTSIMTLALPTLGVYGSPSVATTSKLSVIILSRSSVLARRIAPVSELIRKKFASGPAREYVTWP